MNKILLLALVAGVALATNRREIYESTMSEEIETAYRAGSSYVYSYETQVVSGLPLTAPVYSIVKVKCKVIMEFKTASKVVMKIHDVTVHKLNGRVETVDPTNEIVPDEVLVPIISEDVAIIERALTLPVKFRYTSGFVSGIVCESEDPEWSVNFKKGCLSLLQVNLEKSKLIEASEPVYTEALSGVTVNEAYTVMETSPAGECACTYIVEENSEETTEAKTIEVTKVRNFEECLERPIFYHDDLGPKPCEECDSVPKKPLEARSEVNMVLTGSREQFFIQTAICESSYILTTRERANGYAATYVNQTLEFISRGGVRAAIPEPRIPEECPEGLKAIVVEAERREKMLIAEESLPLAPRELREMEVETERTEEESEMFIEEALGSLRAVALDFAEGITEEGPSVSMVAGDILRSGTYEELKTIWMKYNGPETDTVEENGLPMRRRTLIRERIVEEGEEDEMAPIEDGIRTTLWHLLPFVGTVPAVRVVCDAIREKHMPEYVINYHVFPLLSIGAEPVPEVLELILSIAQSEEIHTRESRRSAWLCVGSLLNRMDVTYTHKYEELRERVEKAQVILATEERGKPRRQLEEIAERTHMMKEAIAATVQSVTKVGMEALTELLRTSEDEGKIIALKAIGNAGIEEMLPVVVECIVNEELPVIVRQQAVYSLRRMTEEIPKEIIETLLPVFLDDDEDELVRIAAFTTILKCDPPAPYLYMIARSLDDEANPLVGSYVYTYLRELSNTTYPCLRSLAVNASLAMKFATDMPEDVHSSYVVHKSVNFERYNLATVMELSVVGSRDSILPRGASLKSVASWLGYNFDFFNMGVETRGIQAILDKMIGPNGILTEGKSIFDIIRPKRSAFSASEIIETISRKLRLVERELAETGVDVFFNYAGNELGYYSVDSEMIKDLIERGSIFTSISEESLRTGYEIDIKIPQPLGGIKTIIATEAGLPLTVHSHMALMTAVTGTWKAEVQPSMFETLRRGTKPTGLKTEMDIKPSCAADIIVVMGVDTAFYKSSVVLTNRAFVHNIRLAGTIEADFKMGKWFTSFETPTVEKKVGGFRSRPTTYFVKTNDHSLTETMEVVAPEEGVIYPVNVELFSERNFGTVLALRALKAQDQAVKGQILFPMCGKQSFILLAKPDENPAERLNVNFQVVSSGEEEETVEEEEEEERGVMGSILDTFWWGEDSENDDEWDENFDLREKDLSIAAIAEQTRAPIIEGGRKNALALTIEGVGTSPPKELRIQCICQRTEGKKRNIVNFKATSTWTGRRKTTEAAFTLNFHRGETTVSEMMNPEYQHMVKEHIKAASIIDPVSEIALSRSNAWWVNDWQRIMTEIRKSGEPTSTITEEVVSPKFDSTERTMYERVEQIIVKQELIARRLSDPLMQTMNTENEERIVERLEEILQQAREVRREAERILASIKERAVGRTRSRNIFIISLKVHRVIRHHKELLERVETMVKTVTIRPKRRERIERILNEELEGIETLFEERRRFVDELNIPEEGRLAPDLEINPEIEPSLSEISEVMVKQVEIAKEVQKVKNALKEGAERSSVIPMVKQILEHCKQTVETIEGVTRELRGRSTETETTITPHMRVFKCLIQEDQIMFHIKEIVGTIKYDPESPAEEVIALGKYCEEHTVKLDAILGTALEAYDSLVIQTAERASGLESVSELPVYMTAFMNVTYTTEGRRPWALQMKIWGDKTLEQLIYETRQASELTRDPEISRVVEEGEEAVLEPTMRRIRKDINTLRKIKFELVYTPELLETGECRRVLEWIETYIKARALWKLSYGAVNITAPPGVAKIDLQFSRNGETVSSAIITPRMTTKFWDVAACPYLPAGVSLIEPERGIFGRIGTRLRTEPATCYYRSENMETFDGTIYRLPESLECEKVLAMDCSPEKSFAILLRERGPEKVIRVVVEKQVVEIIHSRTTPEFTINGVVRPVLEEEPLIIRGEGEYESQPIVLRIEKIKRETIIRAARRGIAVRLTPDAVLIEASPFFRSKVCGMCGNFDGQWRREFEDPARRIHARPESFGVSYIVPHETCPREELETRYPSQIISRPEGCIPVRRNVVKERSSTMNGKEMCISTSPVRRCPVGCEPEGEIRKDVGFHCLPGEDPYVRYLVASSKRRVLEEVESREKDRWETILEPEECIRV